MHDNPNSRFPFRATLAVRKQLQVVRQSPKKKIEVARTGEGERGSRK